MGPLQSPGTSSPALPYYVWEPPGKSISVNFRFDAIERMSPEFLRGLGALKRRGAEVGGLLLGLSEPGDPQKITIEDFEPIPSEYLTGPSYNLSENDLAALEAALARLRADKQNRLSVVGFYRSHTRDDLFMDEADYSLAARYFEGTGHVFLIVKPFATRTSIGGFFFWEDDKISRRASYLEFPFHRTELGGGPSRIVPLPARSEAPRPESTRYESPRYESDRPEPRNVLPERPAPAEDEDDPWPTIRQSSLSILTAQHEPSRLAGKRWMLAPVFLVLAGAAAFFGYQNLSSPKTYTPSPPVAGTALPLKLSVIEKQDQLDVTWDRNSPAIAAARRGVLAISDGANRRDLELTGAQLRNGRVLYSRLSSDVGLRLEVFPESGDSISESIRIVSADAARSAVGEASASTPAANLPPAPARTLPESPAPASASAPTEPAPPVKSAEFPKDVPKSEPPKPIARTPVRPAPRAATTTVQRAPAPRTETEAKPPAPIPAAEPDVELERPARRR